MIARLVQPRRCKPCPTKSTSVLQMGAVTPFIGLRKAKNANRLGVPRVCAGPLGRGRIAASPHQPAGARLPNSTSQTGRRTCVCWALKRPGGQVMGAACVHDRSVLAGHAAAVAPELPAVPPFAPPVRAGRLDERVCVARGGICAAC